MAARRKFWGWGNEGEGPSDEQAAGIGKTLAGRFGVSDLKVAPAPRLEDMRLEDAEKFLIDRALDRHDGNVSQAAKALGLSRSALYRRLERFRE